MSEIVNNKVTDPVVVSISCITYNHAPYIRQCLDGFMMQQTNFAFEVLIHDDASTDGTTEIIKEYEAKYPDIIKPIYEEENQWVKGRRGSAVFNFPRAKGKYIALCEGDDYWTDPLKLQKQVHFLENNLDYVMCSHNFNHFIQHAEYLKVTDELLEQKYSLEDLIRGAWLFHPLTIMFRRSVVVLSELSRYDYMMDAVLMYYLLKKGNGYLLPDNMAVYRIHDKGVWSGISMNNQRLNEYKARLAIYNVEHTDSAAQFLLTQFTKLTSRMCMLKHYKMMWLVIEIINKHYGLKFTAKLIINKLLFNRNYQYK